MTAALWGKVEPTGFCWNWVGGKNTRGYGQLSVKGKVTMAHRAAYEYLVGPIPAGLVIDHLCSNIACVNPDHLEPVTQGDNVRRAHKGLRINSGNHSTHCKRGHEFTPENTYEHGNKRHCRTCRKEAKAHV